MPLRILIVDDNEMSRRLIAMPMDQDGHSVLFASSGQEALDLIAVEKVDLVFLDLLMDDMNGQVVLEQLQSNAETAGIPVVVISSIEDPDAVTACIAAGATDYLFKPAPAARLREIAARINAASKSEKESQLLEVKGTAVLDPAAIEQLQSDYDDTATIGFIRQFLESSALHHQAIADACDRSDLAEVKLKAVDMRGGASTLGLNRLATVCHNLEAHCSSGDQDSLSTQLQELTACLNAAQAALTDFVRARRIED